MKLRFVWVQLFVTMVAFVLLTSHAAWADQGANRRSSGPTLAQYIPADAPLVVSLVDHPQVLQELKAQLPGATHSGQTSQAIAQWPSALLATAGLNYQRDIQPWVDDEVTLALTPVEPDTAPGYVVAFNTRRSADAQACLEQLWQQQIAAGLPLIYDRYQGVSLITTDRSGFTPIDLGAGLPKSWQPFTHLAAAVFNEQQVVLTDSVATLHRVIESAQDQGQSLAAVDTYQAGASQLQQKKQLGFIYANLAALADQTGFLTTLVTSRYQSVIVGISQARQGLLAETVLVSDPSQSVPAYDPRVKKAISALDFVPSESALVAAGVDLNQLWQQVQEELASYPQLFTWVKAALDQGGKPWRLRLAQDILPAISGDYALAMLPPSQTTPQAQQTLPLNSDWVFVLDKRPGAENQQVTLMLDEAAEQQKIGVFPYQLGPQQVSAWAHLAPTKASKSASVSNSLVLNAELTGGYAVKQRHKVMATSLTALEQALAGAPQSMAQADGFKDAIATFQRPNQGYFYLDWPVMRPILESKIPLLSQVEQWAGPWLKQLDSVSVANYGETPSTLRSQILLRWTPS